MKNKLSFWALTYILIFLSLSSLLAQQRIKIALWGDSRENKDNSATNIAHVLLYKITDWDFQVHTGDFTQTGTDESWQRTFQFPGIDSIYVQGKFYMCTSNHDAKDKTSKINWAKYTKGILPINSVDSTTHFYSVHKGNVDVVFCDGYFTDSTVMLKWLDDYLSSMNPNDWLLGVWHNVSYGGQITSEKSYLPICQTWINKLYEHGCKFIFNGHAHIYIRTKPLLPNSKVDINKGIVTIINGTGGATWEEPLPYSPKVAFTPHEKSFSTITFLTFEGNTAHLQTVDCRPGHNLEVIDQCDYTK